jgi:hypothetical protein
MNADNSGTLHNYLKVFIILTNYSPRFAHCNKNMLADDVRCM